MSGSANCTKHGREDGLFKSTILAFTWRSEEIHEKYQVSWYSGRDLNLT